MANKAKKARLVSYLKTVATLYGCKAYFKENGLKGTWDGNRIIICSRIKEQDLISVFFHELAHYKNWKDKSFATYHTPSNFSKINKVYSSYKEFLAYALNAEIHTDQVARKLCKEWMPSVQYVNSYSRSLKSRTDLDYHYREWEFKFKKEIK
jgi:hypothetical protein